MYLSDFLKEYPLISKVFILKAVVIANLFLLYIIFFRYTDVCEENFTERFLLL